MALLPSALLLPAPTVHSSEDAPAAAEGAPAPAEGAPAPAEDAPAPAADPQGVPREIFYRTTRDQLPDPDHFGSTNVPMDSWIYPTLERLGALGFIPSQNVSIRPWTRQECRRQMREVEDLISSSSFSDSANEEAERLLTDLEHELSEPQNYRGFALESVYARFGTIAGPALTDGFHFGQTWQNDFGRPLGRGSSIIAGYSLRATRGRFFFFNRQELQTDPGVKAITVADSNLYNFLDIVPFGTGPANLLQPTPAVAAYVRQRPLELYAGVAFAGNALSFGKQELYWGPTTMGPWAFSSNAEPTYNLRLVSTRPHPYPFLPNLGTYKFDIVFGKLSGHKYPARPYFNGQKVDLTFGSNLEVSFTRWSVLWGVGHPMTLHSLKDNLFSSNSTGTTFAYGDRSDPGDRKSDFDFRLHVPGLHKLVTIYADAYADDEVNPIDAPRRVAWAPGLYLARLPYLPHMDLRFEMASSEELARDEGGTRFFINNQYRDSNTNKGFLLGNAVGRDARAFEGRSGYWFSARTRVEAGYRQTKGGTFGFLPGGSTITDGFLNASYAVTPEWSVQLFSQYERFLIPAYLPGSHHNESGWFQITWNPKLQLPH